MLDLLVKLRAVRRLREIIRSWWGIELMFVDLEGNVRGFSPGERFPAPTPVCGPILDSPPGFLRCISALKQGHLSALQMSLDSRSDFPTKRFFEGRCHAGFAHLALPIRVEGAPIGFILCDGIVSKPLGEVDSDKLRSLETDLHLSEGTLTRAAADIRGTSADSLEKLKDLLSMIFEEAASYLREIRERDERISELSDELKDTYHYHDLIGKSASMRQVFSMIKKVVETDVTVLIQGENGTGKELVARALHYQGSRSHKPYIAQNCAAIHENLLESELFGHLRGAFTGAVRDKRGLLDVADGGTFFLDEIGEMPPALQTKLLRFLQEGTFIPLGGTSEKKVDVRIIAATNRDLASLVQQGKFRQDLYYRIQVITIQLPPLRERTEDIPVLVEHFLGKQAAKGRSKTLSPETLHRLLNYSWPGNVRELEHEIERLAVLSGGESTIGPDLLSPKIKDGGSESTDSKGWGSLHRAIHSLAQQPWHRAKERWVGLFGRPYLEEVLRSVDGNVSKAAKISGLPRSTFYRLLHRHGLMAKPH
ncbi:MAG: sigma 54-interacting transcriptional regulator [Nitrospirae bacterium]|nr:sigma 54-interacting transcriptional regulator [Nitrospirota bacterium]